ncbi:hypothetical protein [Flexithrix dorotheae]|uniref:hypothetical protein n=1 Tax=Flexithrix dorotheae TaxID=70993 RepID=UPI00037AE538|nr:hypothetical protein [Flexithrix dorotheae]
MHIRVAFYIFIAFIVVAFATNQRNTAKKRQLVHEALIAMAEEEEADDEIFTVYQDSLEAYFGPLEISLIKNYRKSYKKLKTDQDFQEFLRNANTLKTSIAGIFQKNAEKLKLEQKPIYEVKWFNEITPGMEVKVVGEGDNYNLFFDYKTLNQKAGETMGNADNEYLKLLSICYDEKNYFPTWLRKINGKQFCSLLGTGKHFEILSQMDKALEHGEVFNKEIHKVKSLVMSDILFARFYYKKIPSVIGELKDIKKKINLNDEEVKLLETRINYFNHDLTSPKIQFGLEELDATLLSSR